MIRVINEEGHYTIKRVKKLPKKGNQNWLYAIIGDRIESVFRALPKGEYEEIFIGGDTDTDNKVKVINFGSASSPFDGPPDIGLTINNLPENGTDYKTIEKDDIVVFQGYVSYGRGRSTFNTYLLNRKGKGVYGIGGTVTVLTTDLVLIETQDVGGVILPPIDNDPNAVIHDLGDIGLLDYVTAINALPNYDIVEGTNHYYELIKDGNRFVYIAEVPNGTYGNAGLSISASDLFLIYDESNNTTFSNYTLNLELNQLELLVDGVVQDSFDLSLYLDDTNLARLVSGVVVGTDLIVTRDDSTTFTIDVSSLIDTGIDPTGLEALDEGNGIGWRLIGRTPTQYGDIGLNAADFSTQPNYTDRGALGEGSFVMGRNNLTVAPFTSVFGAENVIDNLGSAFSSVHGGLNVLTGNSNNCHVFGSNNNVQGGSNFVAGQVNVVESTAQAGFVAGGRNTLKGEFGLVSGWQNSSQSFAESVIGMWSTEYIGDTENPILTDRLFNIGNGIDDLNRSDAFQVLKGGEVLAPDLTVSKIDAADDKVLVTKEWISQNASRPYKVYTATITQSGTAAPIATVLENSLGGTLSFARLFAGGYRIDASGPIFDAGKTTITLSNLTAGFGSPQVGAQINSTTEGRIDSAQGSVQTDGMFNGNTLEIRVYL